MQKLNVHITQQQFEEIIKDFRVINQKKKGRLIMENKTEKKQHKMDLGSTKLSNIIAIISVIISIISLWTANEAIQKVENNIETEAVGYIQTGASIINEGISIKEADYISKDNYKEMMDKAYETEDIIRIVSENPNLHFSIIWAGTEEEHEKTNWEEMPPYVTRYISKK